MGIDLLLSFANGLQNHLRPFERQPPASDKAQGWKRLAAVRKTLAYQVAHTAHVA